MKTKKIDNLEKKFLSKDNFFSWAYRRHNIDFMNDFDDDTARDFITQVRAFSSEIAELNDENKDICVYINSRGGIVTSLLSMIDAMNLVENDFSTICIGQCASCGAVFLSAGTKGKRYITENSRVLIHQVRGGMWGTNSEIQADAKEMERMNKLLLTMLAENCGKTVEEIENLTLGGDLVLTAQEAVDFGIVDAVLTKDIVQRLKQGEDVYLMGEDDNKEDDGEGNEEGKCKPKEGKSFKKSSHDTSSLKLEIKAIDEDDDYYYINGLASTPDIDRVDDIVEQKALMDSVNRIGLPAFIHQHNLKDMPLGVCESVKLQDGKTAVKLKMPKDDYSKMIKDRAEMGAYQGLSIGYVTRDSERNSQGYRVIKALDWYEVSLVTVPANPNSKILSVKNKDGIVQDLKEYDILTNIKTIRDVENLLIEVGCTKKEAGYIISLVKNNVFVPQGDPSENSEDEGDPNLKQENDDDVNALLQIKDMLIELKQKEKSYGNRT